MPSIVHFDIACDDPARGKTFYESLFGWKLTAPPGFPDYYLFDTKNLDGSLGPGGGLGKRDNPSQKITAYFGVESVDKYAGEVKKLGGQVLTPKMPVPGFGWLVICLDSEGNNFGLWQDDKNAR
jgi:predicted enzyme related to lactoylglutathione lyase